MRAPGGIRQWVLAAAGLTMIAAAAAITLWQRAPQAPPSTVPQQATPAGVAMYVQHDAGALRVRWRPDSPEIANARKATLYITDGARRSRLDLNPAELRSGEASYWPESRDVSFRLELDGGAAASIETFADGTAEARPSPFAAERPKAKPRARVGAKSHAPNPDAETNTNEASRSVEEPEPPKRPSRLRRFAGRIPLVRRLRRH